MNTLIRFGFLLTAFIIIFNSAFCQETSSRIAGISASLQNEQLEILVPFWFGKYVTIAPAFGMMWREDVGSDLRIALVPRFYLTREDVSPFVEAKFGVQMNIPVTGENRTDLIGGLAGGCEYFINRYVSVGIEAQINAIILDKASVQTGGPGRTSINTGTAIFGTIYF
ncbi:MAG: hypothetical protein JXA06_11935 [Bacteroidetes bacterium]|nr:hypothetical protein [Bacteroidota bacterium]